VLSVNRLYGKDADVCVLLFVAHDHHYYLGDNSRARRRLVCNLLWVSLLSV